MQLLPLAPMTPKDKLGRDIKVGDYVVYAQRHSSSLWLDIGRVIGVGTKFDYRNEEYPFIKVRGCSHWFRPELKSKAGEVTSLDRVVIIDEQHVPENYLALLKVLA